MYSNSEYPPVKEFLFFSNSMICDLMSSKLNIFVTASIKFDNGLDKKVYSKFISIRAWMIFVRRVKIGKSQS